MSATRPPDLRVALGVGATLGAVSLAQWALLVALGVPGAGRVAVALAAPVWGVTAAALLWFRGVARRRARGLSDAMLALARGDYSVRLGAPPTRAFAAVQQSFSRMAEALDDARARLVDSDARRRRLFADLAHELATPASALLGLADTLAQPELVPDDATRARLHAALAAESQLLARLVEDVRDLSALEDPDVSIVRTPNDLAGLVRRAVAASDVAGLRAELPPGELLARCDATRVEQVLRILLANAARHTPEGGAVEVRLARAPEGRASLTVDDSGPGVPDELLARLGERLFRADPSRDRRTGGHGLGLAIARGIVARHGGAVTFARSPLGGLRVTVTLPADDVAG